jgi:hypothetical protein
MAVVQLTAQGFPGAYPFMLANWIGNCKSTSADATETAAWRLVHEAT